jgi:MGT family glycosyltransferase
MDMVMNLPAPLVGKVMEFLDRLKVRFTSLEQLLQPVNEFPELICCPAEFEMNPQFRANSYYIEPTIRSGNGMGVELYIDHVKEGRKIIYASLGTQTIRYGKITFTFFEKMLAMMHHPDLKEMHMVLCIGPDIDMAALPPPPPNVTVVRWISQIDILNYASLVINHGGIGTVKECIYYGVPMVAFGVRHDQPYNASLIDHHKIGAVINIEEISIPELVNKVLYVLEEEEMKNNLDKMKDIFRQIEKDQPGVRVIERLLK